MIPFPIQIPPDEAMRELVAANQKAIRGLETLSHIREEDIPTGVSTKEAVFKEDKLTLYHYTPLVEQPLEIPVLISYALVNRPYMADLQENRSLVRNLLKLGLALAILVDHLGDNERALRLSEAFMKDVVANLDNDWELTGADIDAALEKLERG